MGDSAKQVVSKPLDYAGNQWRGESLGDTYLNPFRQFEDIQGFVKGNSSNSSVEDSKSTAERISGEMQRQNQDAVAQDKQRRSKFDSDQSAAAKIQDSEMMNSMEEAKAKAEMSKRGRHKLYSSRLGSGGL